MAGLDDETLRDLLRRSTEDVEVRPDVVSSVRSRLRRRRRRRLSIGAAVVAGVTVVSVAIGVAATRPSPPTQVSVRTAPAPNVTPRPIAAPSVLAELTAASRRAVVPVGRFVALSEVDTETGLPGESERTNVINRFDGETVVYQWATTRGGRNPSPVYTEEPARLIFPPDATDTARWYAAIPTEPASLRTWLLSRAKQVPSVPVTGSSSFVQPHASVVLPVEAFPRDQLLYQQANELLWNPLVGARLRLALSEILVRTPGARVVSDARDPAGSAALSVSMRVGSPAETDVTYVSLVNGAILAQEWDSPLGPGRDESDIVAVYRTVTATNILPPDPYTS